MLKAWWGAVLDLIFPQRCPGCREWSDSSGWCAECIAKIAKPSQVAIILHNLKWLDECLAVADYAGAVQRLIRDMKFRRITRQAAKLGQLLDYAIPGGRYRDIEGIVPVPLHTDRYRERGFNQTELIFRPWAGRQNLLWTEALVRTRSTAPQWELNLKDRRANLKGAFTVARPEMVIGKHILLVDDIFTSGLTMNECARVLKKAGAVSVKGLAVASGARQL